MAFTKFLSYQILQVFAEFYTDTHIIPSYVLEKLKNIKNFAIFLYSKCMNAKLLSKATNIPKMRQNSDKYNVAF